jgi:hypothetical protein
MVAVLLVAMVTCGRGAVVQAQEETKSSASLETRPRTEQQKSVRPYRLEFSLNELEDGKKINTRHYSMNLIAGSADEIKIGARVPVATAASSFQYMDVGTKIWANLRESGSEDLQLEVRSEISNLDTTSGREHAVGLAPIVRQIQINGTSLLVNGKPIVIGSMDDPNSNRQFQLEVIATKLR